MAVVIDCSSMLRMHFRVNIYKLLLILNCLVMPTSSIQNLFVLALDSEKQKGKKIIIERLIVDLLGLVLCDV